MADTILQANAEQGARIVRAIREKQRKKIKRLKSLGAKSFEAVYIENGQARSDVHG